MGFIFNERLRKILPRAFIFITTISVFSVFCRLSAGVTDTEYCIQLLIATDIDRSEFVARNFIFNKKAVDAIIAEREFNYVNKERVKERVYVGAKSYSPYAKLGESSSVLYLAKASTGETVVYKHNEFPLDRVLLEYEVAVTEFYRSQGLDIPEVLAYDFDKGVIIKTYEEGLTKNEIESKKDDLIISPKKETEFFFSSLTEVQQEVSVLHAKFKTWLKTHNKKLYTKIEEEIPKLFDKGEHLKPLNYIFNFKKKRWILIDP